MPVQLAAQVIYGQVVERSTGEPVGRGFVVLVDTQGNELARTLSGGDGRFTIASPRAGTFSLRSEVIAFRRWESRPFSVGINQQLTVLLEIERVATRLAALEVIGDRVCPSTDGMNLGEIWEEVRKALAAAAWSDTALGLQHTMHRYYRVEYDRARSQNTERVEVHVGGGAQPFVAVQPHLLGAYGYVWERNGRMAYHGPDADVLLHPSFAATHCFTVVQGDKNRDGMTGIEFTPVAERELPDIEGTLWVNTETAELDMVEYKYVNLPFRDRRNRLGGHVNFDRLSSGAWIVSEWQLRFPLVRHVRETGVGGERYEFVYGINTVGGQAVQVRNARGAIEYWAPRLASVTGRVLINDAPAPFVPLIVAGTGYTTRTRADGTFDFRTLLDDKYRINTMTLDSLFYEEAMDEVRFRRGELREVTLEVPTRKEVMRRMCQSGSTIERAIVGMMTVGENADPVDDEKVEARWTVAGGPDNPAQTGTVDTKTDDLGRYVLCRIPVDAEVVLTHLSDRYLVRDAHVLFTEASALVTIDGFETVREMPYQLVRVDLGAEYGPGRR
jgi:hypothetical protein